ncbi:methyltransferase domain-containing protein [Nocardia amikacinitolerans]|uniref:methyltransferase domain-containing protein n=1 Tax=Nocardia amikacinitolerans TaxID=756689 RepID=UPI0012EED602|nr:class I SAM-dependent methyltransferase [Nocardia amikacinitolerans]
MIGRHSAVLIDLGTGDGRAVLTAAAADPRRLVIGVDANAAGMIEASRKAARGKLTNALFVAAAAERLPVELDGVADAVTVYFPWGSLLRGVVTADPVVAAGLAGLLKPGAALSILVSVTEHDRGSGLPPIGENELRALAEPYAAHGLTIDEVTPATASDIAATGSSWGKRLGAGSQRNAWRIAARLSDAPRPLETTSEQRAITGTGR